MTDWGALYHSHVDAVAALGGGLSEDQLATTVPGSPAWTAHDVYAHLAGGPADQISGRTEGAPGPAWTAQHVAERQGLSIGELLAELRSHADAVAASTVDNPRPAVVWDIAVHHADLHEAFGLGAPPERFWAPIVTTLGPRLLSGLPVAVRCGNETFGAAGPDDPVAEVAPYELFRALFSRRSRTQLRAWGDGLSDEQLDGICIFGPRDDDQPVPA